MNHYDPLKAGNIDGSSIHAHDKAVIRAIKSKYKPSWKKGNPEKTLFVGRLESITSESVVKNFFNKYGKVKMCRLICDPVTGVSRRYAFVEFYSRSDAKFAFKKANKEQIDGKAILVEFEKERVVKGWKPRRLGGGLGGDKRSGQLRFGGRERPFKNVSK